MKSNIPLLTFPEPIPKPNLYPLTPCAVNILSMPLPSIVIGDLRSAVPSKSLPQSLRFVASFVAPNLFIFETAFETSSKVESVLLLVFKFTTLEGTLSITSAIKPTLSEGNKISAHAL